MSQEAGTLTEADILAQVIDPDNPSIPPEMARVLVDLRFNDKTLERMNELAARTIPFRA